MNFDNFLNILHDNLKKTPQNLYQNVNEWQSFYLDLDFYEDIKEQIQVGDFIKIFNGKEYIWCEVKKTDKFFQSNTSKNLIDKILLVRIDNILPDNYQYNYNTNIYIKYNNIIEYKKKDELLSLFINKNYY